MLRQFLFFLFISFSNLSFSQLSDYLYMYDWRLEYLNIDGIGYDAPSSSEVPNIFLFFEESDSSMRTTVCKSLEGEFYYDETIHISFPNGLIITGDPCDDSSVDWFQDIYFDFFLNDIGGSFEISIGIAEPPPVYFLDIYSPSGDWAFYWGTFLGTENHNQQNSILYPNPVRDKLFVSNQTGINDVSISVYNTIGVLMQSENLNLDNRNYINLSEISDGLYFVTITNQFGRSETQKIIKQ